MSTPDPQQPSDPQGGTPAPAQESATEQVAFDKATTEIPRPGTDRPTTTAPFGPLPGQRYDPQTGFPLDPPAPQGPPAYDAAYGPPPGYGPPYYGPQQYYGGYPPPPYVTYVARPTNGMAVASLVLGILWIYWVGSIMALIFGYVARQQIAQRGDSGSGLAIAGIVLGWIGVGTLALVLFFLATVDLPPPSRY